MERPLLAVWAGGSFQPECGCKLRAATIRTMLNRIQGIHLELYSTAQTQVGGIVPDAPGEPLVIRMIGILLLALFVKIVGIPVRPGLDRSAAAAAYVSNPFCHLGSNGIKSENYRKQV